MTPEQTQQAVEVFKLCGQSKQLDGDDCLQYAK